MTADDVRARFEAWATERGLLIRRAAMICGRAAGPYDRDEVQSAWEAGLVLWDYQCGPLADAIDAHLTQPAQAVDVGAIREVIRELRKWPPSELVSDHRATRIGYADKLTAALLKDSNGAEGVGHG